MTTEGKDAAEEPSHAEFRKVMRRALLAMRKGDDPTDLLREALGVKAGDATAKKKPGATVAASLRGRRLLTTLSEDQRAQLRTDIGPTAFDKLTKWDDLLTEWADRMKQAQATPTKQEE